MHQAHFSPVVFVQFRLSANARKYLLVLICGLTAHAPGSFLASRLCSFLRVLSANALKCLLLCFNLWSYRTCARLISRQLSLFIFAWICKCPEMPSLFCFNLWSYCACARLISRQSSFFFYARTICKCPEMPSFAFQSVVLLGVRQAHFSPVVFVHFCVDL